ncbi:MAG: SH3 domain-containing protein, partial [Fimbriimonadaceae bacterium]|nr:SH3 domain-containing protein [Alphaproteobacteria bacterium]
MQIFTKSIFAALATLGVILTGSSAMATPATSNTALNVRTGPGTGFHVVDTLLPGEYVEVTECVSNGWCRIEHPGPDGWVSSNYLTPVVSGGSPPPGTPAG